ncbi:MAG: hypothetical protein B7Y74_16840 [Novosphingobium sp. 35-62-5]|nr:MAG: hypothetical protein B7Y74_16840 [Novosphingobium sp. 35-62-5]
MVNANLDTLGMEFPRATGMLRQVHLHLHEHLGVRVRLFFFRAELLHHGAQASACLNKRAGAENAVKH